MTYNACGLDLPRFKNFSSEQTSWHCRRPARPNKEFVMKQTSTNICYLCGRPLAPPMNVDHPIMQQLFAREIRKAHNFSKLITLPVHQACNTAYKADEDYFLRALILMPHARESVAGNAIYRKVLKDYGAGKEVKLIHKILDEFDPSPSGLLLPEKVVRRPDGKRIRRVIWKMVRGLHFYHSGGEVLPERWSTVDVTRFNPDQPPDADALEILEFAGTHPSRGTYGGVLDYKFDKYPQVNDLCPEVNALHYWLFLLWDRLIFRVTFHDPACLCETCATDRDQPSPGGGRESAQPSGPGA
jgi:hypothetical protein